MDYILERVLLGQLFFLKEVAHAREYYMEGVYSLDTLYFNTCSVLDMCEYKQRR